MKREDLKPVLVLAAISLGLPAHAESPEAASANAGKKFDFAVIHGGVPGSEPALAQAGSGLLPTPHSVPPAGHAKASWLWGPSEPPPPPKPKTMGARISCVADHAADGAVTGALWGGGTGAFIGLIVGGLPGAVKGAIVAGIATGLYGGARSAYDALETCDAWPSARWLWSPFS